MQSVIEVNARYNISFIKCSSFFHRHAQKLLQSVKSLLAATHIKSKLQKCFFLSTSSTLAMNSFYLTAYKLSIENLISINSDAYK